MYDNDNKIAGTIGAVIGALLGVLIWCLLGMMGVIAWIGGFAICWGALFGYRLLGKDVSKIGFVIVLVIVIAAVYFATRMNLAIALHKELTDVSITECYKSVIVLLELVGEKGAFYKDLLFGYIITVFSGVSALRRLS